MTTVIHQPGMETFFVPYKSPFHHVNGAFSYGMHVSTTEGANRASISIVEMSGVSVGVPVRCTDIANCTHSKIGIAGQFWNDGDTDPDMIISVASDLMHDGWTADGAFAHIEGHCDRAICCGWEA